MVLTKALQDCWALPNKYSTTEQGSSSQIFYSSLCPTSDSLSTVHVQQSCWQAATVMQTGNIKFYAKLSMLIFSNRVSYGSSNFRLYPELFVGVFHFNCSTWCLTIHLLSHLGKSWMACQMEGIKMARIEPWTALSRWFWTHSKLCVRKKNSK